MTPAPSPGPALREAVGLLGIPRPRLVAAVLAACATLGSAFALAAVAAYLVARAWTMPPVLDLTVAVVAVRALGVSRGVFRWLERMLTHDVALRGVVSLRTGVFTALAARRDDALIRLRRGDLLTRLGDDAQELGDHVVTAIVPSIAAAVMAVVVAATFAPISWPATAAMLGALVLAGVLAPAAAHRAATWRESAVLTTRAAVSAQAIEILDDATSLRLEGRLEESLEELGSRQRAHDRAIDRAAVPAAVAAAAVPVSMLLAVLGAVLAAGALWVAGDASAGQIGILLLLPLSSFEAATALPAAAAQHARSRAAAERLTALTAPAPAPAPAPDDDSARPDPSRGTHGAGARESRRGLTLRAAHLTVGWSPDAPRVRDLDLDLPPGSRLAVVGPSGCGKSTLLATLAGLLDPLSGHVELVEDGVPGEELGDRGGAPLPLRAGTTMFAEDAHVFATTVRENLKVVRGGLTEQEILAALAAVGLEDWVASLPRGIDTVLGPDGTTVSGGERRRLLLARAVLDGGGILLLDEPTEHLDPVLGDALLHALLTPGGSALVPAHSTVVVVTHRVEAIPAGTPVLNLQEHR